MGLTYKDSGVDIDAGNNFVQKIKDYVKSTYIDGVMGDIGGFGGLFELGKYKNPVLVSGTDGVGTKLKLAFMMDKHDTIGIDAVAMCVNDIVVLGAKPLFFLDYIATGKLEAEQAAYVVKGISEGCKKGQCALIGGETAEMPGFYQVGEYDIAGFAVGVVEKDEIIDGKKIEAGDVIVGIKSTGIHSNGYSLVRKLFFDKLNWSIDKPLKEYSGKTLGEVLIEPTRIYVDDVFKAKEVADIKGIVHITGGGFIENVPRVLVNKNVDVVIDKDSYQVPPIFDIIQKEGSIPESEMYKTFNMGIGLMMIMSQDDAKKVLQKFDKDEAFIIGRVVEGTGVCTVK